MQTERRINATHKAINRPLTILGAERKLFFVSLIMGAAVFNLRYLWLLNANYADY
jgi:hypothetical protein